MNQIIISGNIGKEPVFRQTEHSSVLSFSVASKSRGKDGKYKDTWHNVVAWGELAEFCHNQLHKGSRVIVVGRIQNRKYTARDGQEKYITEINANEIGEMGLLFPKTNGSNFGKGVPDEEIPF